MADHQIELNTYRAELHIHTVLSPCAAVEMIPPLIIQTAEDKGIHLIAITDHNSIGNVYAVMQASQGTNVHVIPGIELQTREEIHSICLFDHYEELESFFSSIKHAFPSLSNNPDFFGEQFIVDKNGNFIEREKRLLSVSSKLSLKDAWQTAIDHHGLLIPAHVNRKLFGLLPVLGFIPTDIDISILEISKHSSSQQVINQYSQLQNLGLIQSGDAHLLEEIVGYNQFSIAEPTIAEIQMALTGNNGRSYKNLKENPPS